MAAGSRSTLRGLLAALCLVGALTVAAGASVAQGLRQDRPTNSASTGPYGFRPPPEGAMVSQALVPWRNARSGERFVAPTGGWTPPDGDWVVEDSPASPSPSGPVTPISPAPAPMSR